MPAGWVAGIGAAIGGIGAIAGGSEQASGQKAAAQTQWNMFNTVNQQEQPFIQSGYGAISKLNELLGISPPSNASNPSPGYANVPGLFGGQLPGIPLSNLLNGNFVKPPANAASQPADFGSLLKSFTPEDFLNNVDPGYQFALQTGSQALRNADTPGVGALSGPALKDLMNFNVGTANQYYQNAFNRFTTQQNNIFGRLSQIAGLGQSAATNVGNSGTALGTGIAQAQAAAAGSTAGGIVGAANALGGGANTLAGLMYLNNQPSGVTPNQADTTGSGDY